MSTLTRNCSGPARPSGPASRSPPSRCTSTSGSIPRRSSRPCGRRTEIEPSDRGADTAREGDEVKKEIIVRLHAAFEQKVHIEQDTGVEFWLARDLQTILGYDTWRNFEGVIQKAITACANS